MTGVIDGAVLGYTYSRVISQKGGRILVELPTLNIKYQGTGLVARRSFIDSSPDAVEKTLKSIDPNEPVHSGQEQSAGGHP